MAEQKSVAPPSLQVGGGGGAESKTQKPAAKKPAAATAAKPKPKPKPATKTAPLSSRSAGASALPKLQFAFPSEASFVCYGDHISLFCDDERQARGFLNADGVIDNSMRVIAEKSGALPNKFRDCIFRVMPSQQYGAAKEFKKKVLALTKAVDEGKIGEIEAGEEADKEEAAYFESLQESALKEEEMNMERNQELINARAVLKYGHTIQLMHVKTGKYVTTDIKRVATQEKDCQYAGLEDVGSALSWFMVLPRYKMRAVGDEVETGDQVIFELVRQEDSFLHCGERPAPHLIPFNTPTTMLFESSVGAQTGWTVSLFRAGQSAVNVLDKKAATRGSLQAGSLVRMFHTERRGYVGVKQAKPKCALKLFIKPDDADLATWRPPASSVWILEAENRIAGPSAEFQQRYRLRHFATGAYLYQRSADDPSVVRKEPVLLDLSESPNTGGGVVLESTSFDDKGSIPLDTGCYLKSSNGGYMSLIAGQTQNAEGVRHDFEWDHKVGSEDAIKFTGVRDMQVKDLEQLASLVPFIRASKSKLSKKEFKPAVIKLLISKLRVLLAFVYRQNISHIPKVTDAATTYDPQRDAGVPAVASRQQAARELGAVEAVLDLIDIAGKHIQVDKDVVPDDHIQWMMRVVPLLFLVVESVIDEHEENQLYVSQRMPTLLAYIDDKVNADRCITTMLTSNRKLLEGSVGQKALDTFLNNLRKNGISRSSIRFLAEVCAASGEAVEENQTKISQRLLQQKPGLLLATVEFKASNALGAMPKKMASIVNQADLFADDGGDIQGVSVRNNLLRVHVSWTKEACHEYPCSKLFKTESVSLETLGKELADDEDDTAMAGAHKFDLKTVHRKQIATCYVEQINLFAELCKERNYIAINALKVKFTFEMCISVIGNPGIHTRLRSAFTRLCTNLWVDTAPQQKLLVPSYTRSWDETDANKDKLPHDPQSNKFILLQELIGTHFEENDGCTTHWDEDTNRLTLEFLNMAHFLVEFGFYNTPEGLRQLCGPLVSTLDGRNDDARPKDDTQGPQSQSITRMATLDDAASYTHALRKKSSMRMKALEDEGRGKSAKRRKPKRRMSLISPIGGDADDEVSTPDDSDLNDMLRYARNDQNELVAMSKMKICDVLVAVTRYTTDVRLSYLVAEFRDNILAAKKNEELLEDASDIINGVFKETDHLDTDNLSKATDICDVLMDLCKYDFPALTSSVVSLMQAQVSQRTMLIDSASKLQLLFSEGEVAAWKQIRHAVETVLDLIERHEVWATLKTPEHQQCSKDAFDSLNWILEQSLTGIKSQKADGTPEFVEAHKVRKMIMNANGIEALVEIFQCDGQLELQRGVLHIEANNNTRQLAAKVNEVLQSLCKGSPRIQEKLVDHVDTILEFNAELENPTSGYSTLTEIFKDHETLCNSVNSKVPAEIVKSILTRKRETSTADGKLLDPLMALVICEDQPIKRNQSTVMGALWEDENKELLVLYNQAGEGTPEQLKKLMQDAPKQAYADQSPELAYYISLLDLLAACCRGKATLEEVRCKSLFTFSELAQTIADPETVWAVKLRLFMVTYDAYLDSDLHGEGIETMQDDMPGYLNECLRIMEDGSLIRFNTLNDLGGKSQISSPKGVLSAWSSGRASESEASQTLQYIVDYVVYAAAAVVGQELYTHAGPEHTRIIDGIIHRLQDLQACRSVEIEGYTIYLSPTHKSKIEHAYSVAKQDTEVGSWVDPAAAKAKVKNALSKQSSRRESPAQALRRMSSLTTDPIGERVLWLARRMGSHKDIRQQTMDEVSPIVDRLLFALQKSNEVVTNRWDHLPPIDLWGLKPAHKIKPQERVDGSVVKLVQYTVGLGSTNGSGSTSGGDVLHGFSRDSTVLRLIEIFQATIVAAMKGVEVELEKTNFKKEDGPPTKLVRKENDEAEDVNEIAERVVMQLTRLGLCELIMYMLGANWASSNLFLTTVDTANLVLDAAHAVTEENRVAQVSMIDFFKADLGEPTTLLLQEKLALSVAWAKTTRHEEKLRRKSKMMHTTALLEVAKAAEAGEPKDSALDKFVSYDNIDPGGSMKILEMLDKLCGGQYLVAQLAMANQELHKEPVDFLIEAARYISTMAKDIDAHSDDLLQAYGTLKSFLTGPCRKNQTHMAMETESVLVTNRILRELFKDATRCYELRRKERSFDRKSDRKRELEKKILDHSKLSQEIVETLLAMIEGRTDTVVHSRILAVVQTRNLRDRLNGLKNVIESDLFDKETEHQSLSEGVEIMNLLLSIDAGMVHAAIAQKGDEPFSYFREKMGRVEIVFHSTLLPVYFLIPPMCQKFSHVPLTKMWETCLPRDDSNLVQYQFESTRIFDMMKQERVLERRGISGLFGTSKLNTMSNISFMMALIINLISISTLAYSDSNSTLPSQHTPISLVEQGITVRQVQYALAIIQVVSCSYLLIANIVLHIPVVYKSAFRERRAERKKENLEDSFDILAQIKPACVALTDFMFVYQSLYLVAALLSLQFEIYGPIFSSMHLMSIAVRNPVARNIFMAVIYPIAQLRIAAIVAMFLLYIFSIVQFFFFREHFGDGECDALYTCLIYTINWGTRAGGGIGENMAEIDLTGDDGLPQGMWFQRSLFDFLFFLIIIIIILNIVFGIIIDTFSDLRSQRDEKTNNMLTTCFICGIGRDQFDQEGETDFKRHCDFEHNKWDYLFYLIHCQQMKEEEPDDLNAYERYVLNCFLAGDIAWMPLGKAITMPGLGGHGKSEEESDGKSGGTDEMAKMQEQMDEMKAQMAQMLELLKKNVS